MWDFQCVASWNSHKSSYCSTNKRRHTPFLNFWTILQDTLTKQYQTPTPRQRSSAIASAACWEVPCHSSISFRPGCMFSTPQVSAINRILMPVDLFHHGIAGGPRALVKKSFLQLLYARTFLFLGNPCFATSAFIRSFGFLERDGNRYHVEYGTVSATW